MSKVYRICSVIIVAAHLTACGGGHPTSGTKRAYPSSSFSDLLARSNSDSTCSEGGLPGCARLDIGVAPFKRLYSLNSLRVHCDEVNGQHRVSISNAFGATATFELNITYAFSSTGQLTCAQSTSNQCAFSGFANEATFDTMGQNSCSLRIHLSGNAYGEFSCEGVKSFNSQWVVIKNGRFKCEN